MTEEERADGAVPNEKHIAFMLPAEDSLRFVHDAGLGIDRALLEKRLLTSRARATKTIHDLLVEV